MSFKSRAIEGVTRAGVLTNHMWLQLTSAIMVGIGFAAIYVNKVRVSSILRMRIRMMIVMEDRVLPKMALDAHGSFLLLCRHCMARMHHEDGCRAPAQHHHHSRRMTACLRANSHQRLHCPPPLAGRVPSVRWANCALLA